MTLTIKGRTYRPFYAQNWPYGLLHRWAYAWTDSDIGWYDNAHCVTADLWDAISCFTDLVIVDPYKDVRWCGFRTERLAFDGLLAAMKLLEELA